MANKHTASNAVAKVKETKEVATVQPTGGAVATFDYGDAAGAGFENQDSSFQQVPFISILQSISPEVTAENSELKAGMIYNSVTQEAIKGSDGMLLVPALVERVFVEWVPRENGGGDGAGFVGIHQPDSEVVRAAQERADPKNRNALKTPEGNQLVETFQMYATTCDEKGDPTGAAIIPFTSTKISPFKAWSSKINQFPHRKYGMKGQPPLFAHLTRMTTVKTKNKKGEFYVVALTPAKEGHVLESLLGPDNEAFQQAFQLYTSVKSGQAKANYATAKQEGGDVEGGTPEVPF